MEAAWLRSQLESGRSIESIAREAGKHPSTVAYWVTKHGLASSHGPRHRGRGGIPEAELSALVQDGLTVEQIAVRLDRGRTTVRYWLKRYGLRTARAREARPQVAGAVAVRSCRTHGLTQFVRTTGGRWRCRRCRIAAVSARRRRVKQILVAEAGGACALCGYDRYPGALHFHHLDPASKAFALADGGIARSLVRARAEVAKCVLVCANCHAEIEGGLATIAPVQPCRLPFRQTGPRYTGRG
jgi:transposase-like protein